MASISMCFLFLLIISYASCGSNEVKIVRGVELSHQPFYNPTQDFTCLDGSKTIPFSNVNDDYCDCADGTDEPGTSACPEGKYFCYNIGYKSKYIPSSRVNDGLCDCCDGSDEYDSDVACFNQCEKFGVEEQEQKKEEMAESIEGSKVKSEYIQSGKEKKEAKTARIETINGLLAERMQELEEAKVTKENAEGPEKEAKERHDKEWDELQAKFKEEKDQIEREEAFILLDVDQDGWVSIAELQSSNQLEADLTETEAKDLLSGETMVDKDGMVNVWNSIKPKYLRQGRPDASKFDESNVNDKPGDQGGEEKKDEEKPGERPDYDASTKHLIEAADNARSHFDSIDKSVRDLESEKKDLEEYLGFDFGSNEEFSALKGQCYEFTDREYVYKLCPFEKVTQRNKDGGGSETDLGNKMSWKGDNWRKFSVMKYEGGQTCWNGPARSTTVHLSCGKDNVVKSVSEPSRCEYEMSFKTPALCDEVTSHDEL